MSVWLSPTLRTRKVNSFSDTGRAHETRFLESLRQKGLHVAAIVRGSDALEESLQAIRSGVPCVYQAYLESGNLIGYADFLMKVEGESRLGPFHYEVLDTKLARSAKPGYLIQLCTYTEMLANIQGIRRSVRRRPGRRQDRVFPDRPVLVPLPASQSGFCRVPRPV